jgi:hypothetical protein
MRRLVAWAILLAVAATGPSRANADLVSGSVASYPFNGDASDASGNGNNGVVFGATATQFRFGHSNGAFSFDGVDDYVRTLDSASLNITGDFAVSAWIRTSDAGIGGIIFSNMLETSPHDGYSIRLTSGGSLYLLSGDQALFGSGSVTTGNWTHVGVVLSGTTARLYVDDVLNASGTVGVPTSSSVDQTIGASYSPFYFWSGSLDDVRIYNRALSPAEIHQL